MVSATGINIQLTFAIAFAVGSGLAGLGGAIGGSFSSLAPGVDANWLLNSLIVVIIGGMGSLGGAAIGALLLGMVTNFTAAYLPADYTFYSIIFTFILLAIVLGDPPARALRAACVSKDVTLERGRRHRHPRRPAARSARAERVLDRRAADADADPGRRRCEPDLPVGLRRHGLARAGRDLRRRGLRARQPDDERQHEGPEPRLGRGARHRGRDPHRRSPWPSSSVRWPAAATGSTS